MRRFLDWFSRDATTEPVLKAAQAHLWFVTIHPFDDGNGRIARAIADMTLARSGEHAAVLQHVGADPAGARRLLSHPRADPTGVDGRHSVDAVVSRLPHTGNRGAHRALASVITKARYWEKLPTCS